MDEDGDLAFELQVMEALAASLGVDSIDIDWEVQEAVRIQALELEKWQQEESDRLVARAVAFNNVRKCIQVQHDRSFAAKVEAVIHSSSRFIQIPDDPMDQVGDEEALGEYRRELSRLVNSSKMDFKRKGKSPMDLEGSMRMQVRPRLPLPVLENCMICTEDRFPSEMASLAACSHRFCTFCVTTHANMKVQEGMVTIECPEPDCREVFTESECSRLLSKQSSEMLAKRILDLSIPREFKVYCPQKNCSQVMDKRTLLKRSSVSTSSSSSRSPCGECLACGMAFCVKCNVAWHENYSCESFQSLPYDLRDAEGAKLNKLIEKEKYTRCTRCGFVVEHNQGCYHMTCRCGHQFCYKCGRTWSSGSKSCSCKYWNESKIIY